MGFGVWGCFGVGLHPEHPGNLPGIVPAIRRSFFGATKRMRGSTWEPRQRPQGTEKRKWYITLQTLNPRERERERDKERKKRERERERPRERERERCMHVCMYVCMYVYPIYIHICIKLLIQIMYLYDSQLV